jgi:hypothetical protein
MAHSDRHTLKQLHLELSRRAKFEDEATKQAIDATALLMIDHLTDENVRAMTLLYGGLVKTLQADEEAAAALGPTSPETAMGDHHV